MTLPSSQNWMSVTYGDGKFVAVAENSDKGAYSTDGITWTEMSLPSTSLIQVIWCKDKFIAVPNNENCILYSLNGTEWTKINVPLIPSRIAFYDGFYVTVPYIEEPSSLHGEIFVSKNGLSWEKTSLSRQGLVLCLVGGEPGFVGMFMLGNNGFLVHINSISNVVDNLTDTSTDKALSANMGKTLNDTKQDKLTAGTGISIEDNTISAGYYALSQSPIASSIISEEQFGVLSFASIAYGNGRFVATPMGGTTVAYSTDQGETWTQVPDAVPFISDDDNGYTHVIYGGGKFVLLAYGDTGVYSEDGITWTPTTLPDAGIWYSAAYGQDRFVAIAAESNLSAYIYLHPDLGHPLPMEMASL